MNKKQASIEKALYERGFHKLNTGDFYTKIKDLTVFLTVGNMECNFRSWNCFNRTLSIRMPIGKNGYSKTELIYEVGDRIRSAMKERRKDYSVDGLIATIEKNYAGKRFSKYGGSWEGQHGNCRYIYYGRNCKSDLAGCVVLADANKFDRWANSRAAIIQVYQLKWDNSDWKNILRHAVRMFETEI